MDSATCGQVVRRTGQIESVFGFGCRRQPPILVTSKLDLETIRKEITMARRLFDKQGWPVIDVTRRSIEETAAAIMQLHARRQGLDA